MVRRAYYETGVPFEDLLPREMCVAEKQLDLGLGQFGVTLLDRFGRLATHDWFVVQLNDLVF